MANDREHGALAPADGLEIGHAVGGDAKHVTLLRFVRPQLHRRQRRIVAGDLRHLDDAADVGVVQQFGDGVGQAAGADVVRGKNGVAFALGETAVDHFLAATLHLGVVALHRGEIEVFGTLARGYRRRGTAAQADKHRRATQHHHRVTRAQAQLGDLRRIDGAQAAGQHDRLVVGAHQAGLVGGLLEAAEIARQRRAAEFVVERGGTDRAVGHDFQRRGHARVERALVFPGLGQRRDAQVRDRKTGEAGLGLAAAAGGTLVADLAAGAGGGARERRDGRGVVVGFDLDREGRIHRRAVAVFAGAGFGAETRARVALHHGGVVAVGGERELRAARVGVLDHAEQRVRLLFAVDDPVGVEDLVPAVFGVGLREHHQFGVGRVAAKVAVAALQVGDFVVRQGQAQTPVGGFELVGRDTFDLAGLAGHEQRRGVFAGAQQGLGHRVVQDARQLRPARVVGAGQAVEVEAGATFDTLHRQAGAAQDFGGLAGPGRHRAQARHHEARAGAGRGLFEGHAAFKDAAQRGGVRAGAGLGFDEVDEPGTGKPEPRHELLQAGLETFVPERRQGRQALEDDHVRTDPWGSEPPIVNQGRARGPACGAHSADLAAISSRRASISAGGT